MDMQSLRTTGLVAQHGSFAAAARVLHVDPSSVSRAVAALEAELGIRIFQRSTRTLSMTEEGEAYLSQVLPLLDEMDHARERAMAFSNGPSGTLKMTTSVAFAHECIVPHLKGFMELYPNIAVELAPTDANLDLNANNIDLAIRLAPAPSGDLISTRLMRTRYLVCASPDYLAKAEPLSTPEDLAHHPCLRFALPAFRTQWRFRQGDNDPIEVPVSGKLIIGNAQALRRAASMGLGPTLLADWLIRGAIERGELVEVFPDWDCTATEFETAAWALYPSRVYLPRKVRSMIDFLRKVL
ncbi:MAG: LysR family transcriptional regulator [Pseudomonadota bacterium]